MTCHFNLCYSIYTLNISDDRTKQSANGLGSRYPLEIFFCNYRRKIVFILNAESEVVILCIKVGRLVCAEARANLV